MTIRPGRNPRDRRSARNVGAITGGQGLAITALIGLTAKQGEVALALASWSSGTRHLAALAIAEEKQGATPITLVDEAERGLEPYRQRVLMQKLQSIVGIVGIIDRFTQESIWVSPTFSIVPL